MRSRSETSLQLATIDFQHLDITSTYVQTHTCTYKEEVRMMRCTHVYTHTHTHAQAPSSHSHDVRTSTEDSANVNVTQPAPRIAPLPAKLTFSNPGKHKINTLALHAPSLRRTFIIAAKEVSHGNPGPRRVWAAGARLSTRQKF